MRLTSAAALKYSPTQGRPPRLARDSASMGAMPPPRMPPTVKATETPV
jgi:hypothetical protein